MVLGETNTVTFTPYSKDIEWGILSILSCAREKINHVFWAEVDEKNQVFSVRGWKQRISRLPDREMPGSSIHLSDRCGQRF